MVCNGYVAGRIAASRGLATFSNLEMQHSPKIFCIFLQKVLAKNTEEFLYGDKPILNNDVILNGIYITYLNYYSSSISADNIKNQSLFIMFL